MFSMLFIASKGEVRLRRITFKIVNNCKIFKCCRIQIKKTVAIGIRKTRIVISPDTKCSLNSTAKIQHQNKLYDCLPSGPTVRSCLQPSSKATAA